MGYLATNSFGEIRRNKIKETFFSLYVIFLFNWTGMLEKNQFKGFTSDLQGGRPETTKLSHLNATNLN